MAEEQAMPRRMTVSELERLLTFDAQPPIEILPDGTIIRREGEPLREPLTKRQDLGGDY